MYESLRSALKDAMKARDEVAVAALRSAITSLDNAAAAEAALPAVEQEADVRDVIGREIAERRSAAHTYDGLGRADTAARLRAEADVLAAF